MNKKWIYCGLTAFLLSSFALADDKANTADSAASRNGDDAEYKTLQPINPEKIKDNTAREEPRPRPRAGSSYTSSKIRLDRRGIPKSKHSNSAPEIQQQGSMP